MLGTVFEQTNVPAPRQITYLRMDQLLPAKRNPKKHAVDRIAASIHRHGFGDVVIVDERTHRLVAGHGRIDALIRLREQGKNLPDGLIVDDDGEWMVPALRGWASEDDDQAEAYIIDHNRLTEAAGYDNGTLGSMLEDLNATDASLFDSLAFTHDELDDIFRASVDVVERTAGEEATAADRDDDGEIGQDEATKAPEREKVRCPECGWHFRPGDRGIV